MQENTEISIGWRVIRRMFHMALSAVVIYYWLPDFITELNVGKWIILLIGGLIVICIEAPRLILGKQLPWNRAYELKRPASYAYALFGAILVLLFFPPTVGVPAIVAMAFADPVAGELRRKNLPSRYVGLVCGIVYALIALALLLIMSPVLQFVLFATIAMSIVAVISEDLDVKYLDDDFTMIILPAMVGYILHAILVF
jgi:hypothetical protein